MATIKKYQERDKKAEYAYKFYLNKGYSPQASASIVGNLIHEGALNTTAEGDKGYKGGSSRGIAQWREERLQKLQSMYGNKWTDFDNQLEFVDWELNNTHKSAGEALKRANTVWEAGRIFTNEFERPKVKFDEDNRRQKNVTDAYKKYAKLELTEEDRNRFTPTFAKDVAPYMNQPTTNDVTDFDISIDSRNFASVPNLLQKEEQTKTEEALNTLKEKEFVKEYQSFFAEQKAPEQQEQAYQPIQATDVEGIFNQVSQFVEAQQGGEKNSLWKNIRANRGSGKEPTKEMLEQEVKIKRNSQQGGIPVSRDGVFASRDKPVIVPSPSISMKGVNYPILAQSLETGEKKLLQPNLEYFFKNTTNVLEIPQK